MKLKFDKILGMLREDDNGSGDGISFAGGAYAFGYQDFTVGTITGTTVTLTAQENGTGDFNSANIVNSTAIILTKDSNTPAYDGAIKLFSKQITVVSHTDDTIVLNAVPNSAWGDIRVWYLYKFDTVVPADYSQPPLAIQNRIYGELGDLFVDEEEFQAYKDYVRQVLDGLDGNGVSSGMQISINADNTKIDISSGTYHVILDGEVVYPGIVGQTLTYLNTSPVTYLAIDSLSGNLIQQNTQFLMSQRRDYVLLGAVIHSNLLNINAINNLPDVALSGLAQLNDLMDGLRNFNKEGNIFSANGANLFLNKSAGKIFKKGVNFHTDTKNPHVKTLDALVAPSNIRYRLSNSTEYPDTQSVSQFYESATGVRTAMTPGQYSIQRITIFPSNLIRIQYGQAQYNSMATALQNITSEPFVTEQNISENGLLRAFLIVKGGATDLSNTNDALFVSADRFGEMPIGSTGGTTSLQQAYSNSVTPEITTNSTLGAVSVKRGSASDTDIVFETLNGAGSITNQVDGHGNIHANNQRVTKEHTGFTNNSSINVAYDRTNRTVTLTGTFEAYYQGKPITALISGWTSTAHPAGKTVNQYLYYDGTNFVWSDNTWGGGENAFSMLQICVAIYTPLGFFGQREPHGFMQHQVHSELHYAFGTMKESGGDLSDYILNSTTLTDRRPLVSACSIRDEDLGSTITAITNETNAYSIGYLSSTNTFNITTANADISLLSGNNPFYNLFTGGVWTQALLPNNAYGAIWVLAVPVTSDTTSQSYRYIFVQGQSQDLVLANIQALTPLNVNLGNFNSPEFVFIGKIIVRYSATNWTLISVESLSGNKLSQTVSPSGNFLSSVSHDTTLTGTGTVTSPLSVVQNYVTLTGAQSVAGNKTFTDKIAVGGAAIDTAYSVNAISTNAVSSAFPVNRGERTTTVTGGSFDGVTGIASGNLLKTTTSGDMTDGFGGGMIFSINDNTMTDEGNYICRMLARRDGGDNIGCLQFFTGANGGTPNLTIRGNGNTGLGLGAVIPLERLHVQGRIAQSDGNFATLGDALATEYVMRATTTTATQSKMVYGLTGSTSTDISIPASSAIAFEGNFIGVRDDFTKTRNVKLQGFVKHNSASSTSIVNQISTVISNENPTSDAWTIKYGSYASKVFNISTNDSLPESLTLSSDLTKMYTVGTTNRVIRQYNLSVAGDISTAVDSGKTLSVNAQDTSPQCLFFRGNGLELYVIGATNDRLYKYTLSTAWDISTATYTSQSISYTAVDTTMRGIYIKPDGINVYFVGSTNDNVYSATMTTPWDVTTLTTPVIALSVLAQDTNATGIFFNPDGTSFYIVGITSDRIYQYALSTPWDASTGTYTAGNNMLVTANSESSPRDLFIDSTGRKVYVVGQTNLSVQQYDIGPDFNIIATVDDTTDVLNFQVTGNNGSTVRWVGDVKLTKVGF